MIRYIVIENRKTEKLDDDVIQLFCELMHDPQLVHEDNRVIIYFDQDTDGSFQDVVLNIMSDTLSDMRVYASHQFSTKDECQNHLLFIKQQLSDIPFSRYYYLDDRTMIKHYLNDLSEEMKRFVLRKFYHDPLMTETLSVYLESNLNMVIASKKLYVHRNTLIQRIDKFYHMTGLDPRIFRDALLIYHLIQ